MTLRSTSLILGISVLALTACETVHMDGGQYWQRTSVAESIYSQGPKAQQMLDRDLSQCVVELRELEGLGAVKDAIPTDKQGKLLDPDEKKIRDWDTPEHNGYLLSEHKNYSDFDGCMLTRGWERIKYVPYEVAAKSHHNWFMGNVNYGYDPNDAPLQAPVRPEHYND